MKFHKYWADVKENRARVGEPFSHKVLLFKNVFKVVTFAPLFAPLPAGDFHHRVHVFGKSEAVLEKDKEKPQDHEREGATARTSRIERRRQDLVFKAFPFNFTPAFASDRPGNAGAHRSCLLSGESTVNLQSLCFCPPQADLYPFLCSYLHSCEPPIIHGNLTCDTIFIQHNGLIKIGSGVTDGYKISVKLACRG